MQFPRIVSFCKDLFVRKNIISHSPLVVDSHTVTVAYGQYKVLSCSINMDKWHSIGNEMGSIPGPMSVVGQLKH